MVEPLRHRSERGGNGYVLPNATAHISTLHSARFVALQISAAIGPKADGEARRTIACPHPRSVGLASTKTGAIMPTLPLRTDHSVGAPRPRKQRS